VCLLQPCTLLLLLLLLLLPSLLTHHHFVACLDLLAPALLFVKIPETVNICSILHVTVAAFVRCW
jgi:hypothetical protein